MCFVHKFRKFSNFELRHFRMVPPIFMKMPSKVAQGSKEKKLQNLGARKEFSVKLSREMPAPLLKGYNRVRILAFINGFKCSSGSSLWLQNSQKVAKGISTKLQYMSNY